MAENRYAVPLEVLEAGVRVSPADHVAEQPVVEVPPTGPPVDPTGWADGGGGDADGD